MTPEEYIQSIIDAIDSAVEPNSITPEMVATVMDYLMTKTGTLSETVGGTSSAIQTMQSAISNIMTQLSEMSDTDDDVAASIQDIWTAIAEIIDAEPVVDTEIKDSGNPVANRAILSAITSITSSIRGKESLQNKIQSITSLSDHTQYPTAKAVYLLVQTVQELISNVDDRVDQNQNAINGLDSSVSSLSSAVDTLEGFQDGTYVVGDTVYIDGNAVDVRDFVLGYYVNGYKITLSIDLPSTDTEVSLSFNVGVSHYDCTGIGIGLIEQMAQCFTQLGYSPTYSRVSSATYHIVILSDSSIGIVQRTGGTTGTTISKTETGGQEGFYRDASFHQPVTGSVGKIYIDLDQNLLYRYVSGTGYVPINSQPFTSGSYDPTSEEIVLNFAGGSVRIPVGNMLPDFTAGKGISITNGVIAQNYLVVSSEDMEDYLAHGTEDGIIRYVYEE